SFPIGPSSLLRLMMRGSGLIKELHSLENFKIESISTAYYKTNRRDCTYFNTAKLNYSLRVQHDEKVKDVE
ncbi:hypothetical protein PMAYCL1PPCAC_04276, partial [Pristionchus mayeri]